MIIKDICYFLYKYKLLLNIYLKRFIKKEFGYQVNSKENVLILSCNVLPYLTLV